MIEICSLKTLSNMAKTNRKKTFDTFKMMREIRDNLSKLKT
jgi:hypothetical protein